MTTQAGTRGMFLLFVTATLFSTLVFSAESETNPQQEKILKYSRFPNRFYSGKPLLPDQTFLIRFNQPVSPGAVARSFYFLEKRGNLHTPAQARPTTREQLAEYNKSLAGSDPQFFVWLQPATPLSIGAEWQLRTTTGLKSLDGSHVMTTAWVDPLAAIDNFIITAVSDVNPYDEAKSIKIHINKHSLSKDFTDEVLASHIEVSPRPENMKIESTPHLFLIHGDFGFQSYDVKIKPGLVGLDGIALKSEVTQTVSFQPNDGFIQLPLKNATQNASGHRSFEIRTANLNSVRTRAKLLTGDLLLFAMKGYQEGYQGEGGERTIPFSLVAGKTIFDETRERKAELDHSENFVINWDQINPVSPYGAYYICSEGESHHRSETIFGAQALVQVTDIGLSWKQGPSETLIYAFSLKNGAARKDLKLRLLDDEGVEIAVQSTGKDGTARFPLALYQEKKLWLDASDGTDRHLMEFSGDLSSIGLWTFDIPYRWNQVTEGERRALLFTDRDVYKPGDTVYLKGISRSVHPDGLNSPDPAKAKLQVTDGRGRTILEKNISLSDRGSFDEEFNLSETAMGYHSIRLNFNDLEAEDEDWSRIFHHSFQVAEYRVNTFEVNLESKDRAAGEEISIPLKAQYYMGKPLSKAKLNWNAYSYISYPGENTLVGFEYGDYNRNQDDFSENAELQLSPKGDALIEFEMPLNQENPAPRTVSVRAEVTDVNQQTISQRTSFRVHSSDFYIGVKKPEGIFRVGEQIPFLVGNVDTNGKPYTEPVPINLTIEKEIWTPVKVMGSDGKVTHRNELTYELVKNESFLTTTSIEPKTGMAASQAKNLQFTEGGDYVLTFESVDKAGRRIATRTPFRVIGIDDPAWAWNDVVAIDVIPDKKQYQVGETAQLLVRSPVFGRALFTTERAGVRHAQSVSINQYETVIEVPIQAGDAPNLFASVLLIRGSADSPHKHPSTDYRVGYCQLKVENPESKPKVELITGNAKYYLPGQQVEVSAQVTDQEGKPLPNAEVTLYGVDEGVLSLTAYKTPDPNSVFYQPFPLSVMMGQSLSDLLPENPLEREFGNKGYVIGGGDDDDSVSARGDLSRMRKDFKALAFWKPSLVTDAEGRVSCNFAAPDNLTTFRVIAVVAKDNQFSSAAKALVINKPIIIEPAIPSFSNLGDQIDITAVLHNNTDKPQDLKVSVSIDEHGVFVEKIGAIIPTSLPDAASLRHRTLTLSMAPGETQVAHFPVAMINTGQTTWEWKAESLSEPGLVDQTRSQFEVNYPNPLFRASGIVAVRKGDTFQNLLGKVDPRLLNGKGSLQVSYSNSRIVEAAEAMDYLLTYPYGCLEQTTSSTLPWLSTEHLKDLLPKLNVGDEKIRQAIEKGTGRMLSMQTHSGGLSYWPGEQEPSLWGSAYAGLALAKARHVVALPEQQLEALWNYLSKNIKDTANQNDPYELSQRCLALYTLALAGKKEESYLDVLYNKREVLPVEAKNLLALAMMEMAGKDRVNLYEQRIESLIDPKKEDPKIKSEVDWYQRPYLEATGLMAWNRFKPGSPSVDQKMGELLKLQQAQRGWGATYSNAWGISALADLAQTFSSSPSKSTISLQFGDVEANQSFEGELSAHEKSIPFTGDQRNRALSVRVEGEGTVYVNWKLETQPAELSLRPENRGFDIHRTYQEVDPEGNLHPAEDLMVGDLVLVRIDLALPNDEESYLAIDDPLPAILEAINPAFESQNTRSVDQENAKPDPASPKRLNASYREIRQDRTLIFANYVHEKGKYYIEYLARVIAPGQCIAPPTRIEAMYQPERFGLSGTQLLSSRPLDLKADDGVAMR